MRSEDCFVMECCVCGGRVRVVRVWRAEDLGLHYFEM